MRHQPNHPDEKKNSSLQNKPKPVLKKHACRKSVPRGENSVADDRKQDADQGHVPKESLAAGRDNHRGEHDRHSESD